MPYDEVMSKWKKGKLKSSSGKKVESQKQAVAIMMSEKERADSGMMEYQSKKSKKPKKVSLMNYGRK